MLCGVLGNPNRRITGQKLRAVEQGHSLTVRHLKSSPWHVPESLAIKLKYDATIAADHKLPVSELPTHSGGVITATYQIDKKKEESKDWKLLGGQTVVARRT